MVLISQRMDCTPSQRTVTSWESNKQIDYDIKITVQIDYFVFRNASRPTFHSSEYDATNIQITDFLLASVYSFRFGDPAYSSPRSGLFWTGTACFTISLTTYWFFKVSLFQGCKFSNCSTSYSCISYRFFGTKDCHIIPSMSFSTVHLGFSHHV